MLSQVPSQGTPHRLRSRYRGGVGMLGDRRPDSGRGPQDIRPARGRRTPTCRSRGRARLSLIPRRAEGIRHSAVKLPQIWRDVDKRERAIGEDPIHQPARRRNHNHRHIAMKSTHLTQEQHASLAGTPCQRLRTQPRPPRGSETEKENHVKRTTLEQRQSIVAMLDGFDLVIVAMKGFEEVAVHPAHWGIATYEQQVPCHAWPFFAARQRLRAASRPIFDSSSGVRARARALPPREPSCCAARFFFRGASMYSSLACLALGPFPDSPMPGAC